ncbi:MAG: thioredoxin family protein [Myxococcota bacterium]
MHGRWYEAKGPPPLRAPSCWKAPRSGNNFDLPWVPLATSCRLSFDTEVLAAERPVLVDFGAQWCVPCRRQEPLLEKLASDRDDIEIVKVDIETSPITAKAYEVRGVPTLVLFRDGKPATRAVGLQHPSALAKMLDG